MDRKAWLIAPAGEGMKDHYKKYNAEIRLIAAPAFNRLIWKQDRIQTQKHLPMLNNRLFDSGGKRPMTCTGTCEGRSLF